MTQIPKYKKSSRLNSKNDEKPQIPIDKSWRPSNVTQPQAQIDLIIAYEDRLQQPPKVIKNYKVYHNQNNHIISSHLVDNLKNDGYFREDSSISFYSHSKATYVFGFMAPKQSKSLNKNIDNLFIFNNALSIKVRNKKKFILEALIEEQREKYDNEEVVQPNSRGNKEKRIGEVVQKVALWRKFYTGFYDQMGNYIQKPLETAANEVGIAKKTLDDYLLQIRNGKKYGFNFNEKVNAKIGQLRAFVREERKKEGGK